VTAVGSAEDRRPDFECLGDMDDDEIEQFLVEVDPPPDGQAFPNMESYRRRRRLLKRTTLSAFVLHADAFVRLSAAPTTPPPEAVDIVLTHAWIEEMPESSFQLQVSIDADHSFKGTQKSPGRSFIRGRRPNWLPPAGGECRRTALS
jgi:hypothetical protein